MLSSLAIVIPVYNGALTLPELIAGLHLVLPTLAERFEAILVEDGSRDNSWDAICQLVQSYPWVRGIRLMKNFGQHNALLCGIRAVRSEFIITMDDDLQHPPAEIKKILDKLAEGYDVVYGLPLLAQHGAARGWASKITKVLLQTALRIDIANKASAFRAFRTQVREAFANYQSPYVSIDVLLTWGTVRFATVGVQHDSRRAGVSNYSLRKLVRHTLNLLIGFSTLPLRVASFVGFSFTVIGFFLLLYVLARWYLEGSPQGFPFLASIITIFSGVTLSILGIIGEYIAQMHVQLMGRPASVIRETAGFPASKSEEPVKSGRAS